MLKASQRQRACLSTRLERVRGRGLVGGALPWALSAHEVSTLAAHIVWIPQCVYTARSGLRCPCMSTSTRTPDSGLRIVHRLDCDAVPVVYTTISVSVRTTVKYAPLRCVELCVFLSPPNIEIEIFMSSTNIPAPPPDTHSPLFTPGPVAARCPRLQPFWDRA